MHAEVGGLDTDWLLKDNNATPITPHSWWRALQNQLPQNECVNSVNVTSTALLLVELMAVHNKKRAFFVLELF